MCSACRFPSASIRKQVRRFCGELFRSCVAQTGYAGIHSVIVNVVKQLKGQHLYWFENTQRCQNLKLPICVGVGSITLQKLARKPIWWNLMRYFGVKNRGLYRTQCTFRSLQYVRYLLVYPLAYRRPPPMDMEY